MSAVLAFFTVSNAVAGPIWHPLPKEAYKFGEQYPEAQNLLFAFDYGHALVYERLRNLRQTEISDPAEFEKLILNEIMEILKNPPNVKVDEDSIAPNYVFTFPLTVDLFDWSHLLHQFVLDVLATSQDRGKAMNHRVNQIYADYTKNKNVIMTDVCKTMMFMDGHRYSKRFRRNFPSFNLLIWSYHWFQIRLYDALLEPTKPLRDKAVAKVLADFKNLISDLPDSAEFDMMPSMFDKDGNGAPKFSYMFPKIAASFDTNHMLHDIISDILTSDVYILNPKKPLNSNPDLGPLNPVPPMFTDINSVRREGLVTAAMAKDPESFKAAKCPP